MLNPDFRDMLSALSAEAAEYLVVGGYAVSAHGYPRATKDLDVWVRPSPENARRVARALRRFGAPAEQVSETELARPGLVLQIGVAPFRVDLVTTIDGVEFEAAWPSRTVVHVDGLAVQVIGRDDLVRNKRATGRPQDVVDAERLEGRGE